MLESRVASALNVPALRAQVVGLETPVPLLGGGSQPQISFDNAASTPALRPVLDAVEQLLPWYSSVHRGVGYKSRLATQLYEEARAAVAAFVGARPDQHTVIFGKNTTEAINKLARRIPFEPDAIVISSFLEHTSNDLPWRGVAEVVRAELDDAGQIDEEHLRHLLRQHAGRVRLVAVSGASNVTGVVTPIYRIAELAHAAGAEIFVDAAQLAPHRAIDMGALDDPAHLDYVALSGHKLYAPFGTGALIVRRDTFAQGMPDLVGGGTIEVVTTSEIVWGPTPFRDEAGSPNVIGAVALATAAETLTALGMDRIAQHETELTRYALAHLSTIPRVQLYGLADPASAGERLGVIPFVVQGLSHFLVAAILSAEFGIEVRNGLLCAQPYLRQLLSLAEPGHDQLRTPMPPAQRCKMPGLVRISFGLYNTLEEVDRLVAALRVIAAEAYVGTYVVDPVTGWHRPEVWPGQDQPPLSIQALARAAAEGI